MAVGEVHSVKWCDQASEFLLRRILRASGVWMKSTADLLLEKILVRHRWQIHGASCAEAQVCLGSIL